MWSAVLCIVHCFLECGLVDSNGQWIACTPPLLHLPYCGAQELTAKARQLELTSGELQQLQEDHAALKSKLERVQQKLQDTNSNLGEVEESRQRSEAQVMLLQDKLEHVDVEFKQLSRQVGFSIVM